MNTPIASSTDTILDLARWAPSGDNTQPWRFETVDSQHVVLHGHDTHEHCVYDLDGWATQLSMGALIETAVIAATAHGWGTQARRRTHLPQDRPTFDLHFSPDNQLQPDPLLNWITKRAVQRRRYATTPLSDEHKMALSDTVGSGHEVLWIESARERQQMAVLLFRSARLRLVTHEAYRVHSEVIEWGSQFSHSKVPDQSLGVPQAVLNMMQFAMHSWERVQFFNRYLGGTVLPRVLMDFLPAMACGAHFALLARRPATDVDDVVASGRAMQRFWLTASKLGLSLQPEMTPLIFSRYAKEGRRFSVLPGTQEAAQDVAGRLARIMGNDVAARGVFIGRIGHGPEVGARSLRLDLDALRGSSAP